jgi:hypothetical protein
MPDPLVGHGRQVLQEAADRRCREDAAAGIGYARGSARRAAFWRPACGHQGRCVCAIILSSAAVWSASSVANSIAIALISASVLFSETVR